MAYLDKNGLNYYNQKISGKIQDVQDDLDELKIIEEEESEVVDVQWNIGTGVWTHFNNQFEFLWGDGSTNPISVNSGEKYFISTYTDASDTPAVILVNNSERYSHGIIEDQYIIATYGNSSLYEGIITIPQNVAQMIVNNTNDHYTPIIKKITKECVKVEKLADANYIQKDYVNEQINNLQTIINAKVDISDLATVATSGDYNDLNNKPIIPSRTSDLTNDSNFATKTYVDSIDTKLENLKITNYGEQEVEANITTGQYIRGSMTQNSSYSAWATCEVKAGETYNVSGSSYYTAVPSVMIFSSTDIMIASGYINTNLRIVSYGPSVKNRVLTQYEDTIIMPENAKLLLVQTYNTNSYPISIVKVNIEKVNRLADLDYLQKSDFDNFRIIGAEERDVQLTPIYTSDNSYISYFNGSIMNKNNTQYVVYQVEENKTYKVHGYVSSGGTGSAIACSSIDETYYNPSSSDSIKEYWTGKYTDGISITIPTDANYLIVQSIENSDIHPPYATTTESVDMKLEKLTDANDIYALKDDIGKIFSYTKTIKSEIGSPSITISDAINNSKLSEFIIKKEVDFDKPNKYIIPGEKIDINNKITKKLEFNVPNYSLSRIDEITFDLIHKTSTIDSILFGFHGYTPDSLVYEKDIPDYPNIARTSIILPKQVDFNGEAKSNLLNYHKCNYTELEEDEFCIAPGQAENEVIIYIKTHLDSYELWGYDFVLKIVPEVFPLTINNTLYNTTLDEFITLNDNNNQYNYEGGWTGITGTQMILSYETTTLSKMDGKKYIDNQVSNLQTSISTKANSADLATVATSGSYNDLNNKPTIPTAISDLIDDSGHYTKPVNGIPASDLADGVIPENFSDRIAKGTGEKSIITGDIENNTATGNYSYAGGGGSTRASANYAHAEGQTTYAEGIASHSEGISTLASGAYSHAEGGEALATGEFSHAEGEFTEANGDVSHAEGLGSITNGENSHAEGAYTITSHKSQHVFGEYNEIDPSNATADQHGNYVEIVGNGTVDNFGEETRSNARTLDWNGNEVLAGKLTVGVNPTNNMDVTTKQYVDGGISNLQTAIPTNLINGSTNGSLHSVNTTAEGANYTMGTDALAIGKNTKAMGSCSVAEGFATQTDSSASGAHAEGLYTHAEKGGAHSEGIRTYATGVYSHAEGTETKAWADSSHSEGKQTNARGPYSHSEGLGTTALNRSQHVFGEYNNLDDGDASVTSDRGRYIEIVGNGTDAQSLSNARTLDWSGNEVLAGKLTVGTNPTNNMDVTTKEYVDNNISTIGESIPINTSDLNNDSGFIAGMTILSYGSSTWNDFITAYNANKVVYCRASSNSNPASGSQTRLAFMAYVNNAASPTSVEFQYYRSVSSHSASQQGDQVYVYTLTSAGDWSVLAREAMSKIVAGTNMSSSYSNGTLTLNSKGTIVTNISGATPVITAEEDTMYVCGEITSLSFTPCVSGICDVRFTSGSTVAVLTIPNTVKFPNSFDPTNLEANKIYEINILDGIYGVVTSWEI